MGAAAFHQFDPLWPAGKQEAWRLGYAAALAANNGGAQHLDIEAIAKRVYDEADQGLSYDEYTQGKKAGIEALEHALLVAAPQKKEG